MSAYLFEGHRTIYLLLGLVLLVLVLAWWQTRKREVALAGAVVLGLLACYFLLDLVVQTDAGGNYRFANLTAPDDFVVAVYATSTAADALDSEPVQTQPSTESVVPTFFLRTAA